MATPIESASDNVSRLVAVPRGGKRFGPRFQPEIAGHLVAAHLGQAEAGDRRHLVYSFGRLNGASRSAAKRATVDVDVADDRGAHPLPHRLFVLGKTTSSTPGISINANSTSAGYTFTPPEKIRSLRRPARNRYPSSSSRPRSPTVNASPRHAASVRTGSRQYDHLAQRGTWPVSYTHLTLPTICSV